MEFYKLPDKFGDYSLDYCTEIEGYSYKVDFAYKGKEGNYYKDKINFGDKEYPADRHYINCSSNAFTAEDLPMLIAMARSFFVSQFPFKTESGEIVCLTIQKDWFEELGINILKADSTAKYYSFKDNTLYIDGIPVDIPSLCKLYKLEDGTYGYGVSPSPFYNKRLKFVVSENLVFGCKSKYLKEMLPYLPLKDTFNCMEIPNELIHIDDDLGESEEMSSAPMYKVTRYEESLDSYNSLFITYEVEQIS
jgi:hypothetical protein